MTWVIYDSDEQAVIEEIERQTDRGAALVAAAFIETRLEAAIKTRLDPEAAKTVSKLFHFSGALGNLAGKIDIGHALHLYPITIRDLLHDVREIRNQFAHNVAPLDFNSEDIRRRCVKPLRYLRVYWYHSLSYTNYLEEKLGIPKTRKWEGHFTLDDDEITARWVYISVVKQILLHLSRVIDVFSPHQFSLPPLPNIPALQPPRPVRRRKPSEERRSRRSRRPPPSQE
jgi:hypothetical protein